MASPDDTRVMDLALRMLLLGVFLYGAILIIAPLAGIIIWAVILAVAVYPMHRGLTRFLGGREGLSAIAITAIGLAVTLGPLAASVSGLVDVISRLVEGLRSGTLEVPPPPPRIAEIPLVGPQLSDAWTLFREDMGAALKRFGPQARDYGAQFAGVLARLGADMLAMIGSVLIMGLLLKPGERLADFLRSAGDRVFAPRGAEFINLAAATVRNVSRGVIGVSAIQAGLAGLVMYLFGIGAAGPLALVSLVLGILQVGPGLVLIPVTIWVWTAMPTGTAILFTALIVPVMMVDNVLRPIFIARGLRTPMFVILVGVLGGMLSFGLVGVFLGPVLLAVLHELVMMWIGPRDAEAAEADEEGRSGAA